MGVKIATITLLVHDYDAAIAFFTTALQLQLLSDTPLDNNHRWVIVGQPAGVQLRLAKATNPQEQATVGRQAGSGVFLFLETDDFWRDYQHMQSHGVTFCEQPREEPYATVAVFEDLCGNRWDLLQSKV